MTAFPPVLTPRGATSPASAHTRATTPGTYAPG